MAETASHAAPASMRYQPLPPIAVRDCINIFADLGGNTQHSCSRMLT